MPPDPASPWTLSRKLAGNVIPLVLSFPPAVFGLREVLHKGWTPWGIAGLVAFPIVGWLGVNWFGQPGNASMRAEMARRWHLEHAFDPTPKTFVGFAHPTFKNALDAHEDIGFLVQHSDRLEYFGSRFKYKIFRSQITGISLRPNAHSWLGLGQWIAVEAIVEGTPIRLLVEPRERRTMGGNRKLGREWVQDLVAWWKAAPPEDSSEPSDDAVIAPGEPS